MASSSSLRIRRWLPTPQQAEFLKIVEPTRQFLHNLPDAIRRQYAGQWIAAKGSQVVAAAPTCAELHAKLRDFDDPTILKLRLEDGISIRWRFPS
jgi:hypothetical protein